MFYELIFIICALCLILKLGCGKKSERVPPELPGRLPVVGHGLMFIGESTSNYKNITWISEETTKRGGIVIGSLGFRNAYCVTDPEAMLTISNTCLEKDFMYNFAKDLSGSGLLTASAKIWKRHRKLLNPAFSQSVLNNFIHCFNSQARNLVNHLASNVGSPFDHEITLKQHNLETICLTATGIGGEEYSSLQQKYLSLVPKIQMVLVERFQKLWFHIDFIYNLSSLKQEQDAISKPFVLLSESIIKKKKADMKSIGENVLPKTSVSDKQKPFLELILDMSNETNCFTDEEIRQETDNIIATGHETTATVLNLALIILGSHADIQEKVYNEIFQIVGYSDKDLDKDDLPKLVYTEAVLKETLRLYPLVPVVSRYIDKDIKLEKYTLKANSSCFLFFYGLNRHPIWGPDADQFKPKRWLDAQTLPDSIYFGSFAIGKRNCIGKKYAMMSMKITLAYVLRTYRVSSDISKVVFKWLMLTYPASGHHYTLERRDSNQKF